MYKSIEQYVENEFGYRTWENSWKSKKVEVVKALSTWFYPEGLTYDPMELVRTTIPNKEYDPEFEEESSSDDHHVEKPKDYKNQALIAYHIIAGYR